MLENFERDLSYGRQAEVKVKKYFTDRNYQVDDMQNNKAAQQAGFDLLIHDRDGTLYRFEVKAQRCIERQDKIILEYANKANRRNGGLGWYPTSKATHFAFVNLDANKAYVCRAEELRRRVSQLAAEGALQIFWQQGDQARLAYVGIEDNIDIFNEIYF